MTSTVGRGVLRPAEMGDTVAQHRKAAFDTVPPGRQLGLETIERQPELHRCIGSVQGAGLFKQQSGFGQLVAAEFQQASIGDASHGAHRAFRSLIEQR